MNVPSTILVFSLFTCAFAYPSQDFHISTRAIVGCPKPIDTVIKVALMEDDGNGSADDELATKEIHLTERDFGIGIDVEFNDVTAVDGYMDSEVEIYLAFWHNCDGVWRWNCTFARDMRDGAVADFGFLTILGFHGRACPLHTWRDRPTEQKRTVTVTMNATCSNIHGPVNVQALLMEEDYGPDDAVARSRFTLSAEHQLETVHFEDVMVNDGPYERYVELYWVFIHNYTGEEMASCTNSHDVYISDTVDFPPVLIDALPRCLTLLSRYQGEKPENRRYS